MMKPGMGSYDRFKELFDLYSKQAGKEQYLIPYFISAHPGTRDEDMVNLALWLKRHRFRLDQVQNFYPSPLANSTTMYYTGKTRWVKLVIRVKMWWCRRETGSVACIRHCCVITIRRTGR
ncbi:putative Fe-S oxidoreductase family 2 [Salmonella enterica subsp. enterica]|uniref:Putative Fe-S oxidoreductase family 2 n=1 Tax=Salmonella enterica I TaxID=59201 RepID=A0A379VKG9_SALET|nr:putative Fe-S oxidoreductase family 2 [Salmonella enterica subsp. enterica]